MFFGEKQKSNPRMRKRMSTQESPEVETSAPKLAADLKAAKGHRAEIDGLRAIAGLAVVV